MFGMIRKLLTLCCAVLMVSLVACKGNADHWGTDLDQGLKEAGKEKTLALVAFTGSDWCPACIQLRAKILNTPEFREWVANNKLVLVELDFPNDPSKTTPEEKQKREANREKYDVQGYPTMLIMDNRGIPYGGVVGAAATAKDYIAALDKALKRAREASEQLTNADALQGLEKARALANFLRSLDEGGRKYCEQHTDILERIAQDDAADETGIRKEAERREMIRKQQKEFTDALGKVISTVKPPRTIPAMREEIKRRLDEGKELLPEVRQFMYQVLAGSHYQLMDKQGAIPYIEAAIQEMLNSPQAERLRTLMKQIQDEIEKEKQTPAAPQPSGAPAAPAPPTPTEQPTAA